MRWLPALLALAAACGQEPPQIAVADAAVDAAAPADGAIDAIAPVDASAECVASADALAAEIFEMFGGCTAVVRLGFQDRQVLGYGLICGIYQDVFEVMARMRAVADTGFGDTEPAISGADPIGALVFSQAPGGAAAVSADTGKSVFGGAIGTRGAAGDYTFPQSFRPPDELAQGCPPLAALADPLGYDLRDGSALAQADVEAAVAAVRQTAIPSAFRRGGRVFVEVVLLYPRIVDAFDPAAAEWVVLVNGGNLM